MNNESLKTQVYALDSKQVSELVKIVTNKTLEVGRIIGAKISDAIDNIFD